MESATPFYRARVNLGNCVIILKAFKRAAYKRNKKTLLLNNVDTIWPTDRCILLISEHLLSHSHCSARTLLPATLVAQMQRSVRCVRVCMSRL